LIFRRRVGIGLVRSIPIRSDRSMWSGATPTPAGGITSGAIQGGAANRGAARCGTAAWRSTGSRRRGRSGTADHSSRRRRLDRLAPFFGLLLRAGSEANQQREDTELVHKFSWAYETLGFWPDQIPMPRAPLRFFATPHAATPARLLR
jgi:hypothetical protein